MPRRQAESKRRSPRPRGSRSISVTRRGPCSVKQQEGYMPRLFRRSLRRPPRRAVRCHSHLVVRRKQRLERYTARGHQHEPRRRAGTSTSWSIAGRPTSERDTPDGDADEQGSGEAAATPCKDMPRDGLLPHARTASAGTSISRARCRGTDGGERVALITDRRIGFWEAAQPAAVDRLPVHRHRAAPERVTAKAKARCRSRPRSSPTRTDNIVALENYDVQPVLLNNVKRERASQQNSDRPAYFRLRLVAVLIPFIGLTTTAPAAGPKPVLAGPVGDSD